MIFQFVPMPPSLNNAYPTSKSGYRFKSKEYRRFEDEFKTWCTINLSILKETRSLYRSMPFLNQMIHIKTDFFFEHKKILTKSGKPKKNDTSNRIKILHDAFSKAIGIDDCYFWDGSFSKSTLPDNGFQKDYCNIEIYPIKFPWLDPMLDSCKGK